MDTAFQRRAVSGREALHPDRGGQWHTDARWLRVAPRAQATAENFPVALRVLPANLRRHLLAIYDYARLVDDIGDEAPGDRDAMLDRIADDLDAIFRGTRPRHSALHATAATVAQLDLPEQPFRDLLEANRRDQHVHRYRTYAELLDYCRLSANPVGRLVLHVFGAATDRRVQLSDRICTALQLIEHCQDVQEDARRGRIYLPADDMRRFGCVPQDLTRATASTAVRRLVAFEADRAGSLLDAGALLVGTLRGAPRIACAGFVAGGRAALGALARVGYDVLAHAARPTRRDVAWHGARSWTVGR